MNEWYNEEKIHASEVRMSILSCQNIVKSYQVGKEQIQVLNDISLSIEKGEYVGIVGPSGSGKTTLLYVLSGLEIPSNGQVCYMDRDFSSWKETQRIELRKQDFGFIFQFYNLVQNITVYENIELAKVISQNKEAYDTNHVLKWVGLEEVSHYYPYQLSGGMQQRIAIARALVNKPKVLFADEPTGNLDSVNGKEIMQLLKRFNEEEQVSIILVTHNADNLSDCHRLIHLRDGHVITHE